MSTATYDDFQRRTANGRNTFSFANTFDRLAPFPLEKYSIFPDYETARSYVAGEGDYDGLAYEGQVITVKEDGKQVVYVVDASATDGLRKSGGGEINIDDINPEDIGAADANHTHPISEVDGLETRLQQIASGASGGDSIMYTVNGQLADDTGNFTVDADTIGAAKTQHAHSIANVSELQTALDAKANANHTHNMVTGITVNNQTLTGNVEIEGSESIQVQQNDSNINISVIPCKVDCANSIVDANESVNKRYQIFVGTDAEWNEFKETINDNTNYLVFIRS